MDSYVAAGWIVTAVSVVLYSWRTIRRGKSLVRSLPDSEKTWR
jgi:hypothetical protein